MADEANHLIRRSQRKRKQHDYRKLNSGPAVPTEKLVSKTWSTTKLYELEVIDSKFVDNKLLVKVHYTDDEWSASCYDSWRDATDVINIPDCCLQFTDELKTQFFEQLKTAIKESLHGQRKIDSKVDIELPIPKTLFEELSCLRTENTRRFQWLARRRLGLENFQLHSG